MDKNIEVVLILLLGALVIGSVLFFVARLLFQIKKVITPLQRCWISYALIFASILVRLQGMLATHPNNQDSTSSKLLITICCASAFACMVFTSI